MSCRPIAHHRVVREVMNAEHNHDMPPIRIYKILIATPAYWPLECPNLVHDDDDDSCARMDLSDS